VAKKCPKNPTTSTTARFEFGPEQGKSWPKTAEKQPTASTSVRLNLCRQEGKFGKKLPNHQHHGQI
jgi:hypothetical protein